MKLQKPTRRFRSLRITRAITLVLLSCWLIPGFTQITQSHRYEVQHRGSDEAFSLIPLKEEGIVLFREKNKYDGPAQLWQITLLDTDLREVKSTDVGVNYRYPFVGYEHAPKNLFLLFRTGDSPRSSFFLIHLSLPDLEEISRVEINPELDLKLAHFTKVGNSMVFGGYVGNEPAIIVYDMHSKQQKAIPGFFQKDNELVDLRVNANGTFNTVLVDRSTRNERKLVFRTFDETGKLLLEDVVNISEDRTLQSSITSRLEREDLLIAGTWGDKQGKQSAGFYALPVDPFSSQQITFLPFGEMDHFTDYLSPKRSQRIKDNARKEAQDGKKPSFITYVQPYRLSEHPKGYLMLAEVYDPVRQSNSYYNSPFNNPYYYNPSFYYNPFRPGYYYPGMRMYRPMGPGQNRTITEIKTEASVIAAFDPNGKLLWDHSLTLKDVKKSGLEQVTDYYFSGSHVYFLYKKKSELLGKVIRIDDGQANEITQKIDTFDPVDEIRSDRENNDGVRYWYDNAFYVWGYQTIRNSQKKDNRVRTVFYVNKVVTE